MIISNVVRRAKETRGVSPAAAMSLKRGCEERPSRRKGGWEVGTEGAGAGAGAGAPWEGKVTSEFDAP